jgi:hypothetical protein
VTTAELPEPSWVPDGQILLAQLATGVREYVDVMRSPQPFALPYPPNLQIALNKLTLSCWHQGARPPSGVIELLGWAEQPFGTWDVSLPLVDVDPDEALLTFGAPTQACEELGALRGDVEGEIRENRLIGAVMDKARAQNAPGSYTAFRRLLIEQPSMTSLELDLHLSRPELALASAEIRDAYLSAPPEAIADGVARTCAGCRGLRLTVDGGREWRCVDASCPEPGRPGPDYPASEGVVWLRKELRTFVVAPGRAELRIAAALHDEGIPVELWPDYDAADLSVFTDDPWVVDVKAWRNPARLASKLRARPFSPPPSAQRAFIVIAQEQVDQAQRYVERLRAACPDLRRSGRVEAVSERRFLQLARQRTRRSS